MKQVWILILAFLLIFTTAFMNTEGLFASTDENAQEEMGREDQAAEEGYETPGHEEEPGEGGMEDNQSPEEELPDEEHQSPEEEQYKPDPEEGRS